MAFLSALHEALLAGFKAERRIDPFIRPGFDGLLREPLTSLAEVLIRLRMTDEGLGLAEEKISPDEGAFLDAIVADMSFYLRTNYPPGAKVERAANTKTYGVLRGEFIVRQDLPPTLRHGVFAEPLTFPAWVRFAGPGPLAPPDIDDLAGILSLSIKLMGVPGPKLLDDERFTQDFTTISTPTFATPNLRENVKLQAALRQGIPLWHFVNPADSHFLDLVMQSLWARTHTSPIETPYWSCVPYLLGEGQAMQYSLVPRSTTRRRVPNLPRRPPDNYLRDALAVTLTGEDVEFDFLVQVQTDARRMPVENSAVRWPATLARPVVVATLRLPRQAFDSPAQLAFAHQLSFNPWHCVAEHRPLGSLNRARRVLYQELSRLRQSRNATPHQEPTGDEMFE